MTKVVEQRANDKESVLFICDFSPPRCADPKLLEPARNLDVDFISVAYNPGKSARVNSAFAAHWIKQNCGRDVVFTLATRDMNKVAIQSTLLGAALHGLENVVILKGDDFTRQDLTMVKDVNDFKSTELLNSVASMNQGFDYKGLKIGSPTSFCIGSSVDLSNGIKAATTLTHKKIKAGAEFFLMQALFDTHPLKEFLTNYAETYGEELSTPIFCGIQMMTPASFAFNDIPKWVTNDLYKGRPGEDIALQVLHEFVDRGFRSIYLIPPILKGGHRDYDAPRYLLKTFRK